MTNISYLYLVLEFYLFLLKHMQLKWATILEQMHLICVIIIIEKIQLRRIIYGAVKAKKTADWFYYKEYLKAATRNEADFAIRLGYSWEKQTRDTLMLTISVVNDENDMRHDREISRERRSLAFVASLTHSSCHHDSPPPSSASCTRITALGSWCSSLVHFIPIKRLLYRKTRFYWETWSMWGSFFHSFHDMRLRERDHKYCLYM